MTASSLLHGNPKLEFAALLAATPPLAPCLFSAFPAQAQTSVGSHSLPPAGELRSLAPSSAGPRLSGECSVFWNCHLLQAFKLSSRSSSRLMRPVPLAALSCLLSACPVADTVFSFRLATQILPRSKPSPLHLILEGFFTLQVLLNCHPLHKILKNPPQELLACFGFLSK